MSFTYITTTIILVTHKISGIFRLDPLVCCLVCIINPANTEQADAHVTSYSPENIFHFDGLTSLNN